MKSLIFAFILLLFTSVVQLISDLADSNQHIGLSLRVERTRGDAVQYCLSENTVYIKKNEFSTKLYIAYELLKASKGKKTDAILINGNETNKQNKDISVTSIISETEGGITVEFRNAQLTANGEYTYVVRHANGTVWLTRTVTIIVLDEPLEEEILVSAGQNLTLECLAKQITVSWVEGRVTAGDWKRNVGPLFSLQATNNVIYKCAIFDYFKEDWNVYKIFKVSLSRNLTYHGAGDFPNEARHDENLTLAVVVVVTLVTTIIIITSTLLCVCKRKHYRAETGGKIHGNRKDSESPPATASDSRIDQTGNQYVNETPTNESARIAKKEITTSNEENTPSNQSMEQLSQDSKNERGSQVTGKDSNYHLEVMEGIEGLCQGQKEMYRMIAMKLQGAVPAQ